MNVYVITKAKVFEPEVYVGVKKLKKEAEKFLRNEYPHMRRPEVNGGITSYVADASDSLLLFIREEEIG